jgi:hypothetical protein
MEHEERDKKEQHIKRDRNRTQSISHINLSVDWQAFTLDRWVDEPPCVANGLALKEKVEDDE